MNQTQHRSWEGDCRWKGWVAILGFLAIIGYLLTTEHRAHVWTALTLLIVVACPLHMLLHPLMHRGHDPVPARRLGESGDPNQ
jgi:hypothetical protein